jgi:hypothetical protein
VHSDFPVVSDRRVGSSILASLSEAGGDVLLWSTSKPLPPHSPSSTKRHFWNAPSLPILQVARQLHGLAACEQAPRNQRISSALTVGRLGGTSKKGRQPRHQSLIGKNL